MQRQRLLGFGRAAGGSWLPFVLLAVVLIGLHVGVLWRAVGREEDAVERAARAEMDAAARSLEAELARQLAVAEDALLRGSLVVPAFAVALRRTDDGHIELDGRPMQPASAPSPSCERLGMDFGALPRSERPAGIERLLCECPLARGPSGALLVPRLAQAGALAEADWIAWQSVHHAASDAAALRRLESVIAALSQRAANDRDADMLRVDVAEGRVRVRREDRAYAGWLITPASLLQSIPVQQVEGLALQPGERGHGALHEQLRFGPFELALSLANPAALASRSARSRGIVLALSLASLLLALGTSWVLLRRMVRLRRDNELRVNFVAAVSHELRTPLASIKLLAELLRGQDLPAEDREAAFASLEASTAHLAAQTERWLTLARLGQDALSARREPGDLAAVVRSVAERFAALHEAPVVVEAAESVAFRFDPMLIALMVENLLANARKYAPAAGPYRLALVADAHSARLICSDRGPGFPADAARLLLPFERGDTRLQHATEGVGLGLSLVLAAAQAHGGSVNLSNAAEGGARVVVTMEAA